MNYLYLDGLCVFAQVDISDIMRSVNTEILNRVDICGGKSYSYKLKQPK